MLRRKFLQRCVGGTAALGGCLLSEWVVASPGSRETYRRAVEAKAKRVIEGRPYSLSVSRVTSNSDVTKVTVTGYRGTRTYTFRFTVTYSRSGWVLSDPVLLG